MCSKFVMPSLKKAICTFVSVFPNHLQDLWDAKTQLKIFTLLKIVIQSTKKSFNSNSK